MCRLEGWRRPHPARADRFHALRANGTLQKAGGTGPARACDPAQQGRGLPGAGSNKKILHPGLLDLKDHYFERDFEDAILRELEMFLLELGAGFSFVARQKRINSMAKTSISISCSTTGSSSGWWSSI